MQAEHKTEKGTILFVKVPDDAYNFTVGISKLYFKVNESSRHIKIDPSGNWQIIGLTSEVTEEQAKMMVNQNPLSGFTTSLEDFKSIMQHLQVYEVNPYVYKATRFDNPLYTMKDLSDSMERTGKWIVLFKEN